MGWKFWNVHSQITKEVAERISQAESDKEFLEKQTCPSCISPKLRTLSLERGERGWEIKFWCDNCNTSGTINHTGFHIDVQTKVNKQ